MPGLFPDADYGFRLVLERGGLRDFWCPATEDTATLAERQSWLAATPERYLVTAADGAAAWQEWSALLGRWRPELAGKGPRDLAAAVGADLVILTRDEHGRFRVRGGAVVFPSGWSLPDKLGLTLAETHGPVPGLNAAIGGAIDRLLDRLQTDAPVARTNWGLAATAELNLHPALERPRLTAAVTLQSCWLRVERQCLALLPGSGALAFGIRIECEPLAAVIADDGNRARLHRALATMPAAVTDYKGLAAARCTLLRLTAPGAAV